MDVSKNRGKTPKMNGENNGKPYEQMDDLGVPLFLETPICWEIYMQKLHVGVFLAGQHCLANFPLRLTMRRSSFKGFIQLSISMHKEHAVIFFFVNSESISLSLLTGSF